MRSCHATASRTWVQMRTCGLASSIPAVSASAPSSARFASSEHKRSRAATARVASCLERVPAPAFGIIVRASQDRTDPAFRRSFTRPVISISPA